MRSGVAVVDRVRQGVRPRRLDPPHRFLGARASGEETCGRSPCDLAKQLHAVGYKLTVHVIAFRYSGFSWTGTGSVMDLMCVAKENGGLYIKANSEEELIEALEKTLDCPMVSQAPLKGVIR